MLLGLGFYYAALALLRWRVADAMYSLFIAGNVLYNGTALLVFGDLLGLHWFYLVSVPILFSNAAYVVFVMSLLDVERGGHPRLYRLGQMRIGVFAAIVLVAAVRPAWSLELDRLGVALFSSSRSSISTDSSTTTTSTDTNAETSCSAASPTTCGAARRARDAVSAQRQRVRDHLPCGDKARVEACLAATIEALRAARFRLAGASAGTVHVREDPGRSALKHTADTRMYEDKRRRRPSVMAEWARESSPPPRSQPPGPGPENDGTSRTRSA